jgi:hypothetical protein
LPRTWLARMRTLPVWIAWTLTRLAAASRELAVAVSMVAAMISSSRLILERQSVGPLSDPVWRRRFVGAASSKIRSRHL